MPRRHAAAISPFGLCNTVQFSVTCHPNQYNLYSQVERWWVVGGSLASCSLDIALARAYARMYVRMLTVPGMLCACVHDRCAPPLAQLLLHQKALDVFMYTRSLIAVLWGIHVCGFTSGRPRPFESCVVNACPVQCAV